MLVSVITPCLNSKKTIQDTLESVRCQSYKKIEYIVVDGGSTDGTVEILKEYAPLFGKRMRFVSEKDGGIFPAMNKGIRMSHGSLVGILNSGDYYEKDAVEKMAAQYRVGMYQVLYGYMRVMGARQKCYICRDRHQQLMEAMIPHPTCFVSRNVYRDFGLYLECFKLASDYELMMRLKKTGKVRFQCIPEIITNFQLGGASSSRRTKYEVDLIRFLYGGLSGREFLRKVAEELVGMG